MVLSNEDERVPPFFPAPLSLAAKGEALKVMAEEVEMDEDDGCFCCCCDEGDRDSVEAALEAFDRDNALELDDAAPFTSWRLDPNGELEAKPPSPPPPPFAAALVASELTAENCGNPPYTLQCSLVISIYCVYVYMYTYVRTYVCMHLYMRLHIYLCFCLYMCRVHVVSTSFLYCSNNVTRKEYLLHININVHIRRIRA